MHSIWQLVRPATAPLVMRMCGYTCIRGVATACTVRIYQYPVMENVADISLYTGSLPSVLFFFFFFFVIGTKIEVF